MRIRGMPQNTRADLHTLAQVVRRMKFAFSVVEFHIIRMNFGNLHVAVGCVVAIWLLVRRIAQPPRAAVGRPPRTLTGSASVHGMHRAPATQVLRPSHINNQVGMSRVVLFVLAHGVVHDSPVGLGARRPNLVVSRARVLVSASSHLTTVVDPDQVFGRISRLGYYGKSAIGRTAGRANLTR